MVLFTDARVEGGEIVVATLRHAAAIDRIYRSVHLEPSQFLDMVAECPVRRQAALSHIRSCGGFISPATEGDMQLALSHGVALLMMQDDEAVGYDRYVTKPEKVWQVLQTELLLDSALGYLDSASLSDWSGRLDTSGGGTITRVCWTDRHQGLIAIHAARKGLQHAPTGRLAWAIDAAVHPDHQGRGIGKALSLNMRQLLKPRVSYRMFKMFEIKRVNGREVAVKNDSSKRSFVNSSPVNIAYTDQEIELEGGIKLDVRWHYWLKH